MTFDGLRLETAPGEVMTPRATSEGLVAVACEFIHGAARIADVGTGSGALAIAIATRRPGTRVWATDLDERAVALAKANVLRHGLVDRVFVCHGDLLDPVPAPLDVIVANLPYLPASAAARYPELAHEPFPTVFSAGDGLDVYRGLLQQAASKLAPEGVLLLQLHGEVLAGRQPELPSLLGQLTGTARAQAA